MKIDSHARQSAKKYFRACLRPDGSLRDTVVFSIIASEWPAVRRHLLHKLGRT